MALFFSGTLQCLRGMVVLVFVSLSLSLLKHTTAGWSSKFCIVWEVGEWVVVLAHIQIVWDKADIYLAPKSHHRGHMVPQCAAATLSQLPLKLVQLVPIWFFTTLELLMWLDDSIDLTNPLIYPDHGKWEDWNGWECVWTLHGHLPGHVVPCSSGEC